MASGLYFQTDTYLFILHQGFSDCDSAHVANGGGGRKAIVDCTHIQLAVSSKESVTFRILHSCHLQCIEQPSPSNHCHRLSTSLTHHCLQQIWSQNLPAEWHWGNVNILCRCPLMRIEEALQHLVLNIHNEDLACYKLNKSWKQWWCQLRIFRLRLS